MTDQQETDAVELLERIRHLEAQLEQRGMYLQDSEARCQHLRTILFARTCSTHLPAEELARLLIWHGVIPAASWDDPDGYDDGVTRKAVNDVAKYIGSDIGLTDHEKIRWALTLIEMETRDGGQWTLSEVNEIARDALRSNAPKDEHG